MTESERLIRLGYGVEHVVKARGKGSGVQLERTYWSVWTIRDRKASKLALYMDRDRALAAIGRW